jgi:hypothetical protein
VLSFLSFTDLNKNVPQALVAHAYNPSYSGGRDQEDCGSKPSLANSSRDPTLKNTSQKKKKIGLMEWLKVKALNPSPSTAKKEKKKNVNMHFTFPICVPCLIFPLHICHHLIYWYCMYLFPISPFEYKLKKGKYFNL